MLLLLRSRHLRVGMGPDRILLTGASAVEVPGGDGGWRAALPALE